MNLSPLSVAFIMLLAAILVIASAVTTILGWVAIAQIRRSAGRLHGLGLALFDGLLFPLLVLDAAFVGFGFLVLSLFVPGGLHHLWDSPIKIYASLFALVVVGVVLGVIALIDFLIIRRVWRAVNAPSANSGPAKPAGRTDAPRKSSAGKWIGGGCAVLAVIGVALAVFSAIAFFLLKPSPFTEARAMRGNEMARQEMTKPLYVEAESAHAPVAFGPVIERTLPLDDKGLTELLDLDTDQVIPSPNPPDLAKGLELLSKPGLVISRDEQKGETELMGMNGVVAQESRADQWEKITNIQALDTIRRNVSSRGVTIGAVVTQSGLPHTFLFKTVVGKIGILQITGFTKNPRGVKIRYKLVQSSVTTASPVSLPPAAGQNSSFDSFVQRVRQELSRASVRFDMLHISVVNADNFIVSFSGLEAHGVSNGKDAWLPTVGALAAQRGFFGGKWDFKGLNQLAVVRFTVADLDLEKLLETNLAEAMPAAPAAAPNLSFGPVVERILTGDPSLPPTFLNLHDGDLVFTPEKSRIMSSKMFADWWQSSSADFLALVMEQKHLLVTLENGGAKFTQIPGDKWDSATAAELADSLQKGVPLQSVGEGGIVSYVLPEPVVLPATFAVASRKGEVGILQITGFTENPRGVKIRYKLVQTPAATPALSPGSEPPLPPGSEPVLPTTR